MNRSIVLVSRYVELVEGSSFISVLTDKSDATKVHNPELYILYLGASVMHLSSPFD